MNTNFRLTVPSFNTLLNHFISNGGNWLRSSNLFVSSNNERIYPMIIDPRTTPYRFLWTFDQGSWQNMDLINWDAFFYSPISKDMEFISWGSIEELPD